MEHSVLVVTIWQVERQEMDYASLFSLMRICIKISLNGVFLSWPWACLKHPYLTFYFTSWKFEINVCVVWLARWSLVSCHNVWKLLYTRVPAKQRCDCFGQGFHMLCHICARHLRYDPFLSSCLKTSRDHWCVLLGNTNLIIIWGVLSHFWVFLIDPMSKSRTAAC